MTMSVDNLVREFLKLSQRDQFVFLDKVVASSFNKTKRIKLIKSILDSIGEDGDFELTEEQKQEVDRRWKEVEHGTARLYSIEEVTRRINKKYGFDSPLTQINQSII